MRQISVEVDIAAWQYVVRIYLLSIREVFYHYFLYYYLSFMVTESVSEVSGLHGMEAFEKKNHNFYILIFI